MTKPRAHRRFAALCAVTTLLVLWLVPSTMRYLCLLDGQSRSECCCPPAKSERPPPSDTPIAKAACCCEIREATVDRSAPAQLAPIFELADPTMVAVSTVVHVELTTEMTIRPRARERGPPPGAHDHLLAKSSLLI